jgi:uncharacterized protein (TIGR02453 family)
MIGKETFDFLKRLKNNNNKNWFDENRQHFNTIKNEFEHFINIVIAEISLIDKSSAQTTSKDSIFRINRDTRFSIDKTPYKTNLGAFIAKGGRKGVNAGYYIHVEPGGCFLAGGIYMPSGSMLKAIREEIFENVDEFVDIINESSFLKNFGKELWGEKLKSAPKGFPKDFSGIEYLKFKHYTIIKNEPDQIYWKNDFIDEIRMVFTAMKPFNEFLNRAVEDVDRV